MGQIHRLTRRGSAECDEQSRIGGARRTVRVVILLRDLTVIQIISRWASLHGGAEPRGTRGDEYGWRSRFVPTDHMQQHLLGKMDNCFFRELKPLPLVVLVHVEPRIS